MEKSQKRITEIIEGRAKILTDILSRITMWDINEVQKIISIHMIDTLSDMSMNKIVNRKIETKKEEPKSKDLEERLEEKRIEICRKIAELHKIQHSCNVTKVKKKEAANKIILLKPELRRINIALNTLQNEEECILLRKFIVKTYGEFALDEFYKTTPLKNKKRIIFE